MKKVLLKNIFILCLLTNFEVKCMMQDQENDKTRLLDQSSQSSQKYALETEELKDGDNEFQTELGKVIKISSSLDIKTLQEQEQQLSLSRKKKEKLPKNMIAVPNASLNYCEKEVKAMPIDHEALQNGLLELFSDDEVEGISEDVDFGSKGQVCQIGLSLDKA